MRPAYNLITSLTTGMDNRQGPHQGAVQKTRTGRRGRAAFSAVVVSAVIVASSSLLLLLLSMTSVEYSSAVSRRRPPVLLLLFLLLLEDAIDRTTVAVVSVFFSFNELGNDKTVDRCRENGVTRKQE